MQQQDFDWTTSAFRHTEKSLEGVDHLAIKALGVVHKHFLVPLSDFDLAGWGKQDHYRHHITELMEDEGDDVWIKPWIVGQWLDDRPCVFRLEPTEFMEEALKGVEGRTDSHRRGAIFGVYLTIARKKEGWDAVFAFRLDDKADAGELRDVPVSEALCLSVNGDREKLEQWLDWAYAQPA
ncbi:MAG TPA: hypothetical protein ENI99_05425 [Sedimenticola sp.]|nr:hypothetical protein [Sedimenticola sp.]